MAFKKEEKENFCIEWTYTIIWFSLKVGIVLVRICGHGRAPEEFGWGQQFQVQQSSYSIIFSVGLAQQQLLGHNLRNILFRPADSQYSFRTDQLPVFCSKFKQVIWIYKDIMIIKLILSVALLVLASNCLTQHAQVYSIVPGLYLSPSRSLVTVRIFPDRLTFRGCNTNSVNIEQFGDAFQIANPNSWSVSNQTVCEDDRDSSIRNLFNTVRRSVKVGNQLRLLDEKR